MTSGVSGSGAAKFALRIRKHRMAQRLDEFKRRGYGEEIVIIRAGFKIGQFFLGFRVPFSSALKNSFTTASPRWCSLFFSGLYLFVGGTQINQHTTPSNEKANETKQKISSLKWRM